MFIRFYLIVGRNAIPFKNYRLKLCNLLTNKSSLHTSPNKLTWPVFSDQPYRVCLNYSVNLIDNLLLQLFYCRWLPHNYYTTTLLLTWII